MRNERVMCKEERCRKDRNRERSGEKKKEAKK